MNFSNNDKKQHILIPALLTAAAAYFGFKGKSEQIAEITKQVVTKAINHQTQSITDKNKAKKMRRYRPSRRKMKVYKLKG
jgi:hypothetical protein